MEKSCVFCAGGQKFSAAHQLVASRRRIKWSRAMAGPRAAGHPRADDTKICEAAGLATALSSLEGALNEPCPALAGATQGRRSTGLVHEWPSQSWMHSQVEFPGTRSRLQIYITPPSAVDLPACGSSIHHLYLVLHRKCCRVREHSRRLPRVVLCGNQPLKHADKHQGAWLTSEDERPDRS